MQERTPLQRNTHAPYGEDRFREILLDVSQENVEVVRRHMAAYLSGDYEAALAAYHPEVVFDATARPEGGVYRGRQGIAEGMRVWRGTWDDWDGEVEALIDAGDKVLMVLRESGIGKGSRVEVSQETFFVLTLREGQIVHSEVLVDKRQALEAAGVDR
jgi:ketosteroid isomerase-like protein